MPAAVVERALELLRSRLVLRSVESCIGDLRTDEAAERVAVVVGKLRRRVLQKLERPLQDGAVIVSTLPGDADRHAGGRLDSADLVLHSLDGVVRFRDPD